MSISLLEMKREADLIVRLLDDVEHIDRVNLLQILLSDTTAAAAMQACFTIDLCVSSRDFGC